MKRINKTIVLSLSLIVMGGGVLYGKQAYETSLHAESSEQVSTMALSAPDLSQGSIYNLNGQEQTLIKQHDTTLTSFLQTTASDAMLFDVAKTYATNANQAEPTKWRTLNQKGLVRLPDKTDMEAMNGHVALPADSTPSNPDLYGFVDGKDYWTTEEYVQGDINTTGYVNINTNIYSPKQQLTNGGEYDACSMSTEVAGYLTTTAKMPSAEKEVSVKTFLGDEIREQTIQYQKLEYSVTGRVNGNSSGFKTLQAYTCDSSEAMKVSHNLFTCKPGAEFGQINFLPANLSSNSTYYYAGTSFLMATENSPHYNKTIDNIMYETTYKKSTTGPAPITEKSIGKNGGELFAQNACVVVNKYSTSSPDTSQPLCIKANDINNGTYSLLYNTDARTDPKISDNTYGTITTTWGSPYSSTYPITPTYNTPAEGRIAIQSGASLQHCTEKEHEAQTSHARPLLQANLSSVLFASENKSNADQNTLVAPTNTGSYLTAKDTSLKANGVKADQLGEGYTYNAETNTLTVNKKAIVNDQISIPVDISGSTYETSEGFTSTPVIAIEGKDGLFGRVATSVNDDKTLGTATLNISNLATATNGSYDSQTFAVTLYNNELISNGDNDKYMDYISEGKALNIRISGEQVIEWNDSDAFEKAILNSETMNVVANVASTSAEWDTTTDFTIDLGSDAILEVKNTTHESYTSTTPYTGEKGKVTFTLGVKEGASFTDGESVTVKVKKGGSTTSGYDDSNELTYSFKLYHPMSEVTTTATASSTTYGDVVKDTALYKVTMSGGMPKEYSYSLTGADAAKFSIASGNDTTCGAGVDCAFVSAKEALDYKASKYVFDVEVKNNLVGEDYTTSKTKAVGFALTQKAITIEPTLSKASIDYLDALPTIGYKVTSGAILANDTSTFGKMTYHYENDKGETVSDMSKAGVGSYKVVFDAFVADDSSNNRSVNYTITANKADFTIANAASQTIQFSETPKDNIIYKTGQLKVTMDDASKGWDGASNFSARLSENVEGVSVKVSNQAAYTTTTSNVTNENGQATIEVSVADTASFENGKEVIVYVKKQSDDTKYFSESKEVAHTVKLYRAMKELSVEPYDAEDSDLSNIYGSVQSDTKLFKVNVDGGKLNDYKFSLEGSDASKFAITQGDTSICGEGKICAIVSANTLLDYKATAYDVTIKVENDKNADDTYNVAKTKAVSYTITKRDLDIQPVLSESSISYGGTLPTVTYKAINSTNLIGSDVGKLGKMNYHYTNDKGETIDISKAPKGTYTAVFDSFEADDTGNKRYENYTITSSLNADLTITAADSSSLFINDVSLTYGDTKYSYSNMAGEKQESELILNGEGGTCSTTCSYTYKVKDGESDPSIKITNANSGAFEILKAGSTTIVVTKPGDAYYQESSKEISVTVKKKDVAIKVLDQTLSPSDTTLPTNDILLADDATLAYAQSLNDFDWTYKYLLNGNVETSEATILANRGEEATYKIQPTALQKADGPLASNYNWIVKADTGNLSVVLVQVDSDDTAKFYTIDEVPTYKWYNKEDKLGIHLVNETYSQLRVYLKHADGSNTLVRDYSDEDYIIDKNLCNGSSCTFALRFRDPITNGATQLIEEVFAIDNVLPEIKQLTWSKASDSLAWLKSMFDDQYATPAKVSVDASDATSGLLDYSYVISEIDETGKAIGTTKKVNDTSDASYTISDRGYYRVDVTVRDKAHNTSSTSTTYVAIDDQKAAQPELKASVDGKEWDNKWTSNDITIALNASKETQGGDVYHSEFDSFEVMKPNGSWESITGDTYTTSENEINGTYQFRTKYKNGETSAPASMILKVDKKAHDFTISATDLEGNALTTAQVKGMIFTLNLKEAYASDESWYVFLQEEGSTEGDWEPISLSDTNTWTLMENFKGKIYFKSVSEAGVSSEEDITKLLETAGDIYDEAYIKITATTKDGKYRGTWSNQPITIQVSGGSAIESDVETYAFSFDDGTTWTNIKDMNDDGLFLHSGNNILIIQGEQEINTDVLFKAVYSDTGRKVVEKSVHVQYDKVVPNATLQKTPSDEHQFAKEVSVEAVLNDEASSSSIKRYSFDNGKTWVDEVGTSITETFTEKVSSTLILEDQAGNQTSLAYNIMNVNQDKPAVPSVVNQDTYMSGNDNWFNVNQKIIVNPSIEGTIYYRTSNGTKVAYNDGIEISKEGRNIIEVWVEGYNGVVSDTLNLDVNLDFTVPKDLKIEYSQGNILEQLTDFITGQKIRISISADDELSGLDAIQYQVVEKGKSLSEDGWKTGTSFPLEGEFDGQVYARAIDRAGNIAKGYTDNGIDVKIDGSGPSISTIQDITTWTNQKTANVRVNDAIAGVDATSFYYQLGEDAEVQATLDNFAFDIPLKNGEYDIHMRVSDVVGNESTKTIHVMIDQSDVVVTPTYDSEKANVTITTGASGLEKLLVMDNNCSTQNIAFTKVSDGNYSASYTFKTNGTYKFVAVNAAGTTVESEAHLVTTITATNPVLGVSSDYIQNTWSKEEVSFSAKVLNGVAIETLEYRMDNDVWKTYSENTVLKEVRDGTSTYYFIANRGLANESEMISFAIKLDTSEPVAPTIVNQANYTNASWYRAGQSVQAKLNETSGSLESIYYSLDGGTTWTKADTYTFQNEGSHEILFKTMDEIGRSSNTTSATVNIDLSAPSNFGINIKENQFKDFLSTITFGYFYNDKVDVSFDADYAISGTGSTYYYLSDTVLQMKDLKAIEANNQWQKGDSFSLTPNFKGVVYAKTSDKAGNMTGIISSDGIEINYIGAVLNVSNKNGTNWGSDDVVTITSSDFANIKELRYVIQSDTPETGTLAFDQNGKAQLHVTQSGQYPVEITALDKYGNETTSKVTTKIDAVAPSIKMSSEAIDSDRASLNIKGSAGISGIKQVYLLNKQTNEKQSITLNSEGNFTYTATMNGTYEVTLTNGANTTVSATAVVDNLSDTTPVLKLTAISNGITYVENTYTTANVDITLSEVHSYASCVYEMRDITTNASATWSIVSGNTYRVSEEGIHHYQFRVKANGKTSTVRDFTVKISKGSELPKEEVLPKDEEEGSTGNDNINTSSPVILNPEPPVGPGGIKTWIEYRVDGGEWQTSLPIKVTGEGNHNVEIRTKDELGRVSESTTHTVVIDTIAPQNLSIQIGDNTFKAFINNITFSTFFQDTKELKVQASDGTSGVVQYQYQLVKENEVFNPNASWQSIDVGMSRTTTDQSTITLPKGFKGAAYVRAVDRAGNISNVVSTDGIVIDAIHPDIQITHDLGEWASSGDVTIALKDELSGIQEATYEIYKNDASNTLLSSGNLVIDAGKATLHDVPNGESKVVVKASDQAGNTSTAQTIVKMDKQTPTIRSEVNAGDVTYKDIITNVEVGASGIKEVRMNHDSLGTKILSAQANGTYSYRVYTAGTYQFSIVSNSGLSATTNVVIANGDVVADAPVVGVKGESIADASEYISNTWTGDGVRLHAVNLTTDLTDVVYQYYYSENFIAPDSLSVWKDCESDSVDAFASGVYYFRGVIKGSDGKADIIGEASDFIVKIDLDRPGKVSIENADKFVENKWYDTAQTLTASFRASTTGVSEWVEMKIDDGNWKKISPADASQTPQIYTTTISQDGKHTVSFKAVDGLGRESLTVDAHVNIDTTQIGDETLNIKAALLPKEHNAYRDIELTPTFGASGIKEIRFLGNSSGEAEIIKADSNGKYIYRAQLDGTYSFRVTSGIGKTADVSIVVTDIYNEAPIIGFIVKKVNGGDRVLDYSGWLKDAVTIEAENLNTTVSTPVTTEFSELHAEDTVGPILGSKVTLNKTGTHRYRVTMSYTLNGTPYTTIRDIEVKLDFEAVSSNITITNEASFGADKWIGSASNISEIQASFPVQSAGCEEWVEYSMDQGVTWTKGINGTVSSTIETLPDDIYTFLFRTNDELDTGKKNVNDYKKVIVQIDRSSAKLFRVNYQPVNKGALTTLYTLITNKDYEFSFGGDFAISGLDHIDYRMVSFDETFDPRRPNFDSTLTSVSDTIAVERDYFDGKVCGQGVDKAGNKTAIICSDGLLIDKAVPEMSISSGSIPAADANASWYGVKNNITVTLAELPASGFKEKTYTLTPIKADASDTREVIQGELSFSVSDGARVARINDIPNGKWTFAVKIVNNVGVEISDTKEIRIDTTTPTIKNEAWTSDVVENFDLVLHPTSGVSGIAKVEISDARDVYGATMEDYPANMEIIKNSAGKYAVNIKHNGYYSFKVTANNGFVSYLKNVAVTNIKMDQPVMQVKAVTYSSDDTAKEVPSDTWAMNRIELTFTLQNQDKIHEQVIWMVRNDDAPTPTWSEVLTTDTAQRTNKFHFDSDGVYHYSFKAVAGNVESDVYSYVAKIDTTGPSTPSIDGTYGESVYFNTPQNVLATFVKDPIGCIEKMQYRIYTVDDANHTTILTDWSDGEVAPVNHEGKTFVEFRTIDELGRMSSVSKAIVMMDSYAPTNLTMRYETNTIKQWLNTISFGNYYKDYVNVNFSASDDGDPKGDALTYLYVLVDKADVASFDAYAEDVNWLSANNKAISIAPDWEGLVYAKVKDRAGNETIVIRSDGISIDNVEPVISFTPNSFTDWNDNNSLQIHVSDAQENSVNSGLNLDKVIWSNTLEGDKAVRNQSILLDADGNATLYDLADGQYQLRVSASDLAGNTRTNTALVKFDSVLPSMKIQDIDLSKPAAKNVLTLLPTVGGSGIKEFKVTRNGNAYNASVVTKIVDGKEVHTVDIIENGFYEFSFMNGAGKESNKASIQIENINDETPYIIATAKIGDTNYQEGSWTDQNVEVTVTSKMVDTFGLELFYVVSKDGAVVAPDSSDTTWVYKGVTWKKFDGHLSVNEQGVYSYQFIGRSVSGKASPVVNYRVNIDKSSVPDVTIENEATYTASAWFTQAQTINATFTDSNTAIAKVVEYNLDDELATGSKQLEWREGSSLLIKADGKHKIVYRVRNAFGKVGNEKTIYVNVDAKTPSFTYKETPKEGASEVAFVPSVGSSGLKSFTLMNTADNTNVDLVNYKATITTPGTYRATLTSNAGLSYTKEIVVSVLSDVQPIVKVNLSDPDASDTYFAESGLWESTNSIWASHKVQIDAIVSNVAQTGKTTLKVNVDGLGWVDYDATTPYTQTIGDTANYEGSHHYECKAVSESGIESEVVSVDIYIDQKAPNDFAIENTTTKDDGSLVYKNDEWQSNSQRMKANFKQSSDGSDEWIEYTIKRIDDGKNEIIAEHVKGMYYDLNESGIYEVQASSIDALGRVGATKTFKVKIDQDRPTNLSVKVEENEFRNFLQNLTLGMFFKDTIEVQASADFGISKDGTIYLQMVDTETDYVQDLSNANWNAYTGPISVSTDWHKIIYFYAVDVAGNTTDIYRSDGITVDKVAPTISVQVPNDGNWTSDGTISITATDPNAIDEVKDLSGGIKEISYTTTSDPIQSGSLTLNAEGKATLDLADGTYDVTLQAKDYAGNDATPVTKTLHIDRAKPTIQVNGHNAGTPTMSETWNIVTSVGASGYQMMDGSGVTDVNGDAIIHVAKTIKNADNTTSTVVSALRPNETYTVNENGTYIFTVTSKTGEVATQTMDVQNISTAVSTMDVVMTHLDTNGSKTSYEDDTWTTSDVEVMVTSDALATIQYKVKSNNATTTPWTKAEQGKFTIDQEGISTVSIRAVSLNGTPSDIITKTIKIDTIEPLAPYILNIDAYDAWYNQSQQVKAVFTPSGEGCDEWVEYRINNGNWTTGDIANVNAPGESLVEFRTMDALGRSKQGDLSKTNVHLDLSAPSNVLVELQENSVKNLLSTVSFHTFYNKTQDVVASADFSDSGVGYFEYQVVKQGDEYQPNNNWKRVELSGNTMKQKATLTSLTPGFAGTIYVRAIDVAGNISGVVSTSSVAIDDIAPTIQIPSLADGAWLNSSAINIQVSDANSGVDWDKVTYSYQKDGVTRTGKVHLQANGSTTFSPVLESGIYELNITANDIAGNQATAKQNIRLDTIKAHILEVVLDPEDTSTASVDMKIKVEDRSISGIKAIRVFADTISETNIIDSLDADGYYHYTATSNATYQIRVETNAGLVSEHKSVVSNIETADPVLKISPVYTQDDKKGQAYVSDAWAYGNIDVTVENVIRAVDVLGYYYRVEALDGTEIKADTKIASKADKYVQRFSDEGSYKVFFWAVSVGGRESDRIELRINIDRSAPSTPKIIDEDTYTVDDWTNNTAGRTIKVTSTPTTGASEWVEYNLNDEAVDAQPYWRKLATTGELNIQAEGSNKLVFRTVDETGRSSSTTRATYINLDTSAPSDIFIKIENKEYRETLSNMTFGLFYKDSAEVSIDGNFEISGLDYIEYQVMNEGETFDPNGTWKKYQGVFYVGNEESQVVYARAYDRAGNVTKIVRSDSISVDQDSPIITYPDYSQNDTNGWIMDNWLNVHVEDQMNPDTSFSGVKEVTYETLFGDEVISGTAQYMNDDDYMITDLPDGSYYLHISASDEAGNVTDSYFGVAIDTKKPNFVVSGDLENAANQVALHVLAKDIVVGASGLKELKVTYTEGENEIVQVLHPDALGDYAFTAYENNTYTFTLTNKAGNTITKDVLVTNIQNVQEGIQISGNVVENTWMDASSFTFDVWTQPQTNYLRYRFTRNATVSGEFIEVNDSSKQIVLNQGGRYVFEFESYDPNDVNKTTLKSRTVNVWIDGDTPNAPIVNGNFTENDWYSGSQRIRATSNNVVVASDETIQYRVDAQTTWTNGDNVNITEFGRHKVFFRIIDEVGHTSSITTAFVNVSDPSALSLDLTGDTTTPVASAKMSIWPQLAQAPIASIRVRNLDSADNEYHEVSIRSEQSNYSYYVQENGRYEVVLTDQAGNKATRTITFNNISNAESKLVVTKKNTANITVKDEQWSDSDVTIIASDPSDPSLVASKITYTIGSDATAHAYATPIKVSEEGIVVYHFTLSRKGEVIERKDVQVKIDKETPLQPSIKDASKYGVDIWFNEDFVKVEAMMDGSSTTIGSKETLHYKIDEGDWIEGSFARVYGEGIHTVLFKTIDEVAHESVVVSTSVNIDHIAPSIALSVDKDSVTKNNTVTIQGSDNRGIAKIYYKKVAQGEVADAIAWSEEEQDKVVLSLDGTFTGKVYAYAVDLAGNASAIQVSDLINTDYSVPTINLPSDMSAYTATNSVVVSVDSGNTPVDPATLKWEAKAILGGTLITQGTYTLSESGQGMITNLPNGVYQLFVTAGNTGGNTGTAKMHVMIENYPTTITSTLGALASDKKSQAIDVLVEYAGSKETPAMNNLRPDKLYVKEGALGEWIEVENFDATTGAAQFSAIRNGIYTFKAVNTQASSNTVGQGVEVTGIEQPADAIDLNSYIAFVTSQEKCSLAQNPVANNGNCTFTSYKNMTSGDVTLIILKWSELEQKMTAQNLHLVQRVKSSTPTDYETVTWGEDASISGAKVIKTYIAKEHFGKTFTLEFALMDDGGQIVETVIQRRFGFSLPAGTEKGNAINVLSMPQNQLQMQAFTPIQVNEGMAYQITDGSQPYTETGWKDVGTSVTLGNGTYTLYSKTANGEIQTKELNVVDQAPITYTTQEDAVRSFLHKLTFNLFFEDTNIVKVDNANQYEDLQYSIQGTWMPYEDGIRLNASFNEDIYVKASIDNEVVINTISLK